MSADAVLSIFDQLRRRVLMIDDKHAPDAGYVFSMCSIGHPIRPQDFRSPWRPGLQLEDPAAAQSSAANINLLVDRKLRLDGVGDAISNTNSISASWEQIVKAAEASPDRPPPNEMVKKRIYEAKKILYKDPDDPVSEPSKIYENYEKRLDDWATAREMYSDAYAKAMSSPETANSWPTKGVAAYGKMMQAYDKFATFGQKDLVESAKAVIASEGMHVIDSIISDSEKLLESNKLQLGNVGASVYYVNVLPSDWAEPYNGTGGWTTFGFEEKHVISNHSQSSSGWGGNAGASFGWWSVGGGGGTNAREEHRDFSSTGLAMEITYGTAMIYRPWFNTLLLNIKGWRLKGADKGVISDGTLTQKQPDGSALWIPSVPVKMLIIKKLKFRTDSLQETYDYLYRKTSGGGGFGWGPFTFGGSGGSEYTKTSMSSRMENGWLTVDGAQLAGWVSEVLPYSPWDSGV